MPPRKPTPPIQKKPKAAIPPKKAVKAPKVLPSSKTAAPKTTPKKVSKAVLAVRARLLAAELGVIIPYDVDAVTTLKNASNRIPPPASAMGRDTAQRLGIKFTGKPKDPVPEESPLSPCVRAAKKTLKLGQ